MAKFIKVIFDESMMGESVTVVTHESAISNGFEVNKAYKGKLKKRDWLVGCPVFECKTGILGLDYDCHLVKKIS